VGARLARRHQLTDQAWAQIAPLLPLTGRPGGQWADHRRVVNGILWKLAVGYHAWLALAALLPWLPA
jgi:transposase